MVEDHITTLLKKKKELFNVQEWTLRECLFATYVGSSQTAYRRRRPHLHRCPPPLRPPLLRAGE